MSRRHTFANVVRLFTIRLRHLGTNKSKIVGQRALYLESLDHRALLAADTIFPVGTPIVSSDPDRGDYFGEPVAMTHDGLLAVVGARYDDEGAKDAGAAYLLQYDGTSWNPVQKLTSSSPRAREAMGSSVAITGSVADATVVVGTGGDRTYVFTCVQNECTSQVLNAGFAVGGISRHANGETLVGGTPQDGSHGPDSGAALVFERSTEGQWSNPVKLFSPTPGSGEQVGTSAAISQDGTIIAIGATGADEVQVFERTSSSAPFSQADHTVTITTNTTNNDLGSLFGWDVDLSPSGEVLVISALWETFVTAKGSAWPETLGAVDRLDPGQQDLNRFGWTVDFSSSGGEIVVGTSEAKAFVFESNETCTAAHGFCLSKNLVHNDPGGGPLANVAAEGGRVLVGNRSNDVGGVRDAGAVHVYDLDAVVVPTVTIEATDANAAEENADPGSFTVSRTGDMSSSLDVFYSVSGSATPDVDYTALPTTVTIPAGSSSAPIQVTPIDDEEQDEGVETVIATISNHAAYTIGASNSDTVTIADNDSTPTSAVTVASISPPTMSVNDTISVTITGAGFEAGATLAFSGSHAPQPSNVVVVDSTTVTAKVKSHKKFGGVYTVVVTNPSGSFGELESGLTVTTMDASSDLIRFLDSSATIEHVTGDAASSGVIESPDAAANDAIEAWFASDATLWQGVAHSEGYASTLDRGNLISDEDSVHEFVVKYEAMLIDEDLLEMVATG